MSVYHWLLNILYYAQVERDERSDDESEAEEEGEDNNVEEEYRWDQSKGTLNSKLTSLADNCVLNNLAHQRRNMNSRLPKAR